MKLVGLIGGMSWESTAVYYRLLNHEVRARLGGLHSARCLLYSVDFDEIERAQHQDRWDDAAAILVDAARRLERGGAELLVLCTNTMHRVAGAVEAAVAIPLLHIADATAAAVRARGIGTVGLLGTAFTMEQRFYRGRLEERHGLEVLVPPADERARVHEIIYRELCLGVAREESRAVYREVMRGLTARGARGIVLGCTEIMLLVGDGDASVPLFDTTALHVAAAVQASLG
jgi:aspartate racemase